MKRILQSALLLVVMLMTTINANAWKFTLASPEAGQVEMLYQIVLNEPAGTSFVDEWGAMSCTMTCSNGKSWTYNMSDNMMGQVAGVPSTYEDLKDEGTYTLTIPEGTFHIGGEGNEAQTFTWTIGSTGDGETTPDQPAAVPFEFNYDAAEECLSLTWPEGTVLGANNGGATLTGYNGYFNLATDFFDQNKLVAYVALAPGDYVINIPAGAYLVNGTPCEAISYPFTIAAPDGPVLGGGTTEDFFTAGDLGYEMIESPVIETEGAKMTTESFYNASLDFNLPVRYSTNEDGTLDWNNGTKLIFTSKKDNITGIEFKGNWIQYASADKGTYDNGIWTGTLAAGESVTLTAADGINIEKIKVHYNGGADDQGEDDTNKPGEITITWPQANSLFASIENGGTLAKFTTTKDYAQVTVELRNLDEDMHNLYDFPVRYMDNVKAGEVEVKAQTPGETTFYLFKGDAYKLIIKGYVNPWDQVDNYDAMAEIPLVGDGKEREATSSVKLVSISPADGDNIAATNQKVTLEFDGPVKSVKAVTPMGFDGEQSYATAASTSDRKVWTINLGDLSSFASAETEASIVELNITAKDDNDATVVFSNDRSDRALVVKYNVVEGAPVGPTITLGAPIFTIQEGETVDAAETKTITVSFPNATGVDANYELAVLGTLSDKSFGSTTVSASGTMGRGVRVPVSLADGKAYHFEINTVMIGIDGTEVWRAENLSYYVNFVTGEGDTGGDVEDNAISITPLRVEEGALFVKLNGIDDVLPNLSADHYYTIATVLENGVNNSFVPDMTFGGQMKDEFRLTSWNSIQEGNNIITIPAGAFTFGYWPFTAPEPETVYTNAQDIVVKFSYNNGVIGAYEEETEPEQPTTSTTVVLYEYGATVLSAPIGKTLFIEKDGVHLNFAATQSFLVPTEATNFGGLRVSFYNTWTFASEKKIEKIEFETNGTIIDASKATTLTAGQFDGSTWTGSAETVTMKFSNDQTITKITVTVAETATGINNVNVYNDGNAYNLAGQRVNASAKGIVIKNGQKFIVK